MLQKSPELMREIVDFVDRFYARYGRSPRCLEIESGTTLKRSSVHNYLVAMDEQGMIEYNGQTIGAYFQWLLLGLTEMSKNASSYLLP